MVQNYRTKTMEHGQNAKETHSGKEEADTAQIAESPSKWLCGYHCDLKKSKLVKLSPG